MVQVKPFRTFWSYRWVRLSGQVILILLLTLLMLEIVTRLIWGKDQFISIFDRRVILLPMPVVSEEQIETLTSWAAGSQNYLQFDPVLGWSINPGVTAEWEGVEYTSNSIGIRSLREYEPVKPEGIIRIGTFGPSFTHGDEVKGDETWQAQMEQARPDLEVMNWGIGGYGTDQAFLRYQRQGAAYQPDIVIIGFEEDNVNRNVNRFRPFFRAGTGLPLTKPVFVPDGDELVLIENPFPDLASFQNILLNNPNRFLDIVCPHDYFCERARYQPLALDLLSSFRFLRTLRYEMEYSEAKETPSLQDPYVQQVNFLLIQTFVQEILKNGSIPVVLIFPELHSIQKHELEGTTDYEVAVTMLREKKIQVIDLAPAFVQAKKAEQVSYSAYYASEGGHFNQAGNRVVAQTLLWHLCSQGILNKC